MPLPLFAVTAVLALRADTTGLRAAVEARIAATVGAEVAVAYRAIGTADSLDVRAGLMYHAASTMKIPVLIELFRRVDAGALSLDQSVLLVNQFRSVADGSTYTLSPGDDSDSSVYARVGTRVPLRDLAEHMITRSSNLATNALIALVGAEHAQATARALGATTIEVLRGVEDGKAYDRGLINRTSARDLAALLEAIETGRAASAASCRAMRAILLAQQFNELIPAGLPAGTPVAHKTGTITATAHDAAVVYPRGAAPYVLVVLTRAVSDEHVAAALIAELSRIVYAYHTGHGGRA